MKITYEQYLDKVYGGWLGKCIGGTIGVRFEGKRHPIDIDPNDFFPDEIPANDDLDLQMVWLKVLEEKGAAFTVEDLAKAWFDHCWYPFSEYGLFKRNWRLGIKPPECGVFSNAFWKTGMGCPIRSEIWGYVNPGDPDTAAAMAYMDGTLDHGEQAVGAEMMFSAMSAMAFFDNDIRAMIDKTLHYLPVDTPIERLCRLAIKCFDANETLRFLHESVMANAPCVEACDAQINVPFTIAGLLYGQGDMEKTIVAMLELGYDTDCTLATSIALLGQILGAKKIPKKFTEPIDDQLVMGIQYKRPDMRVSAVAEDTARVGCLIAKNKISDAPELESIPHVDAPGWNITTRYHGLPSALPGEDVHVSLICDNPGDGGIQFEIKPPEGWDVTPTSGTFTPGNKSVELKLHWKSEVPVIACTNIFKVTASGREFSFGIKGAEVWKLLGVFYETTPIVTLEPHQERRYFSDSYIDVNKAYLADDANPQEAYRDYSRKLGRPAVVVARELLVDFHDVIQFHTPWVAYVEREIICKREAPAYLAFGHNSPIDVWVNGEFVGREHTMTTSFPEETSWRINLREGVNTIRVKIVCHGSPVEFSSFIKQRHDDSYLDSICTWEISTDIDDVNPFLVEGVSFSHPPSHAKL